MLKTNLHPIHSYQIVRNAVYKPRGVSFQSSDACATDVLNPDHFPPLFHPLPGFKLPPCIEDNAEQHPTKITVLPNGLKIASENSTVSLSIFLWVLLSFLLNSKREPMEMAMDETCLHLFGPYFRYFFP